MTALRKPSRNPKRTLTILERRGGMPVHMLDAGPKASSRSERKPVIAARRTTPRVRSLKSK